MVLNRDRLEQFGDEFGTYLREEEGFDFVEAYQIARIAAVNIKSLAEAMGYNMGDIDAFERYLEDYEKSENEGYERLR